MSGLVRAELRKVVGTRLAGGLLLGALAIVVIALGFTLWGPVDAGGAQVAGASRSLATESDLIALLGVSNVVGLFALLFGVTFATTEFRHGTAATTFLIEPHRWRVLAAKGAAAGVTGTVYAVASLGVSLAVVWVYAATQGLSLPLGTRTGTFVGMTVAAAVCSAVQGVGIGAAIRSQVGAVVGTLLWLFVVESLLGSFLPDVARYTPFAVGTAMTASEAQVGVLLASVLSVGYALLLWSFGTAFVERRDTL